MKIAFITNICSHYRVKLFEELHQSLDIDFYFFSDGSEWYWDQRHPQLKGNFRWTILSGFSLFGVRFNPSLLKVLFDKKYDLYIKCINGKIVLPLTFIISKLRRKPFILWTGLWKHPETFVHRLTFPITRFIYRHADAIVVYGTHVRDYLIGLGVSPVRIFIAWNTVDNDLFGKAVTQSEKLELRAKLGIPEHEKVILFTGRLEPVKGLDVLIDAFACSQYQVPATLILIGEGSEKQRLIDLAKKKSVNKIYFLNYIDNHMLYRYYALADVFVLPSITTPRVKEAWGLVINEAMNQGCPVIATNAVGAAVGGLLVDEITGYIIDENNPSQLSNAILFLLKDLKLSRKIRNYNITEIKKWTYHRMASGFIAAIHTCSTGKK